MTRHYLATHRISPRRWKRVNKYKRTSRRTCKPACYKCSFQSENNQNMTRHYRAPHQIISTKVAKGHKFPNSQTPITTVLATHLLHKFIVNVKHRMDWSYRKPYIFLSFNFWKQYPADWIICLTSVNMQEYVTSLSLLWKSPVFPDLYWNSLTW